MIWESQPWKDSLLKDADKLEGYRLSDDDGDDDGDAEIAFEKTIFIAGFTIRKLIEAKKLTDRIAASDVKCHRIPLINSARVPDHLNWHNLQDFYDHNSRQKSNVKLTFLTNQLIHSFIFGSVVNREDDRLVRGFFVATDFDRSKFLYRYELPEMIRIMKAVGNDNVVESRITRDQHGHILVHNYGPDDQLPATID